MVDDAEAAPDSDAHAVGRDVANDVSRTGEAVVLDGGNDEDATDAEAVAAATAATAEEDARLLARPREELNDAERAYLDARDLLLSGKRPVDPGNLAAWKRNRLRVNPTTVSREAGFDRAPIAGHRKAYGYIFRLLLGDADVVVKSVDEPPELGPAGFERSLQQLRSRNVEKDRRIQVLQAKSDQWDAMVAAAAGVGSGRRRGRRPQATAET